MTPQQIYNYLTKNGVPEILAASIADNAEANFGYLHVRLVEFLEEAFAWGDSFSLGFWHALTDDIDPYFGGQNFWLNPLLLPKQFRPKKVIK
jgi:hypothetical protein